ncbi:MAG TPA: hypothetical protein P5277_02085 [Candidatus Paceibacterota bacterium]|nr:hypothetical protein [Candidatus Paceibacterota bacterium]
MKIVFKIITSVIILLLAIPIGYILKHYTKEEIKSGRKYFFYLFITSIVISSIFLFIPINFVLKSTIIFGLLFIAIVSFISWKK